MTDKLLEQLREAAGYGWPEMVRYTFVDAIVGIAGYGISLLILAILIYKFDMFMHKGYLDRASNNTGSYSSPDKVEYYGPAFVVTAIAMFVGFFLLVGLANSLSAAIAPEGATVMRLVKGIKP